MENWGRSAGSALPGHGGLGEQHPFVALAAPGHIRGFDVLFPGQNLHRRTASAVHPRSRTRSGCSDRLRSIHCRARRLPSAASRLANGRYLGVHHADRLGRPVLRRAGFLEADPLVLKEVPCPTTQLSSRVWSPSNGRRFPASSIADSNHARQWRLKLHDHKFGSASCQ